MPSDEEILDRMAQFCQTGMTPFELRDVVVGSFPEGQRNNVSSRWDELFLRFVCPLDGSNKFICPDD